MIDDQTEDELKASAVRLAIFLRVETDPIMRLWAGGVGSLLVPIDTVETEGGDYQGLGQIAGLPAVESLINGAASRADFTLSGVTSEIVELADDDADDVMGAPVFLGFQTLDGDYQPSSQIYWLWNGEADVVRSSRTLADGNVTRTITLSVGSEQTGRRRPKLRLWTDAQQRERSPDDRFCERTNLYSQGATSKWPAA